MNPNDLGRALLDALDDGLLQRLYRVASVEPDAVLRDLGGAAEPLPGIAAVAALPLSVIDPVAQRYVREAARSAALSGASLGLGGWIGVPPGLLHLTVLLLRLAQRLSLAHGVDFRTDRGEIELWKSLALAVGARVDWEGTEAELMRRMPAVVTGTGAFSNPLLVKAAQAVVLRIAVSAGSRVTRLVPVIGAGSGALLNYLEVRRVGGSLKESYRARHAIAAFDPREALEVEIIRG